MSKIIQNAVYIPEDNIYLVSSHVHDFIEWASDKDGASYFIDGGREYFRSCNDILNLEGASRIIDYRLTEDTPWELIATHLLWGTRGVNGDKPLTYKPIMSLTIDHLRAILKTQPQIVGTITEKVVKHWIEQKIEERLIT